MVVQYRSATKSVTIGKVNIYNSPDMNLKFDLVGNNLDLKVYNHELTRTDHVTVNINDSACIDVFNSGKVMKTVHVKKRK
jgi:hypothetical protein